jgi:adenylate cyclase
VLHGLRDFYYTRGEKATSDGLQHHLDALAARVDDPVLRLQAHHSRWTALVSEGQFAKARACLDEGLVLYDRERYRASEYAYGHDPGVCGLVFSSLAHWALGHADRALEDSRQACTLARALLHPSSEVQAGFYAAMLRQLRGEVVEARDQAEATIRLTRDQGFAFFLAHARVVSGWARSAAGQPEQGVAEMRAALADMLRSGTRYLRPYCQALLAEALVAMGRQDEARAIVSEGLEESRQTGQIYAVSELLRLEGESWAAAGEACRAEACLRQALAVARSQGAPAFEEKAAVSLSRVSRG